MSTDRGEANQATVTFWIFKNELQLKKRMDYTKY
jgi:hypothetical protein